MKKLLLAAFCSLLFFVAGAQTSIPAGNVNGTWTLSGSPYLINGHITVLVDSTLTIEPGVTVNFQGHYKFNVQGRIIAIGTITDTIVFTSNNTSIGWWGIRFDTTHITQDSSQFVYCKLQWGKANSGSVNDNKGGAFFLNSFSKIDIKNSRIINNTASYGGGIYGINTDLIIKDNVINDNFGGGIYCENSSLVIYNNIISNNSLHGGVFSSSISTAITNNTITENRSSYSGGGIYCGSCTVENNIINNNEATNGGGIYCALNSIISNNTIIGNSVSDDEGASGGGIYAGNGCLIIDNVINGNSASCFICGAVGGGIYGNSETSIINNIIINNQAGYVSIFEHGSGGGIKGGGLVANNIICNNSAHNGGGINGSLSLKNNIVSNNNAFENGGGIYSGSTTEIYNCTVSNNSSSSSTGGGGGIFLDAINTNIKNVILWGNSAISGNGQNVYLDNNSNPTFNYCDIQDGNVGFFTNGNVYSGNYANNINTNPFFLSPSAGAGTNYDGLAADWSLQNNSSCINTGTPDTTGLNLPATDLAGNPRINVCRVDIGTYEYQDGVPLTATVLQTQQLLCFGDTSAEAIVIPEGGVPPYAYLWSDGQTTSTATGLIAGTYSVSITESGINCVGTKLIVITQPIQLTFSTSKVNVLCNGFTTGSITINASGGTGTILYSIDGGTSYQSSNIFTGLNADTYNVLVKDENDCVSAVQSINITEPSILEFTYTQVNVLCNGNSTGSITVDATGGIGNKQYSKDNGNNFQSSNVFNNLAVGTYEIVVKDANNCVTLLQQVTITEPPAITSFSQSQTNVACNTGSDGVVVISASGGTGNLTYTWSPNVSTTFSASNLSAGTYTCTITDENNCTKNQQVVITEPDPVVISVCLISVDTNSTHNIIYWEKPITALVDSFFIYREITTGTYSKIAAVAYEALSEYHDYEANPNLTSYKYKISVLDTCGFEGEQSDYHNSIHLLNLGNGNLLWTLYEIEHTSNPVTYYRVYRDDFGTNNFQPINSTIPGGNTTYTDVNYSSYPNAKYVVDVSWGISCTPFRSTVVTSRSNQWSDNVVSIEDVLDNQVKIYPNPANEIVTIEFLATANVIRFEITNMLGEMVYKEVLSAKGTTTMQIDVSGFASGIYMLGIQTSAERMMKKIVVE